VLTLWRDLHAVEVSAKDMADAITLAQFYLSEAARLAHAATVSTEMHRAEKLRKWLLESWAEPEIILGEALQKGPYGLRDSKTATAALTLLEKHGWLQPLAPGTVVRGSARKAAWRIVRGGGDVV
jgi:hypothetical protein